MGEKRFLFNCASHFRGISNSYLRHVHFPSSPRYIRIPVLYFDYES